MALAHLYRGKIVTALLAVFLLLSLMSLGYYGCYQVVYATNEGSYQYQSGSYGLNLHPVKTLVPITPTGDYLTPDLNKSAAYNMGFAQGYLGFPLLLKGHHTSQFLMGYKNGTGLYWLNRGDAEGYYNIHPTSLEKKNSQYMSGWNQASWNRLPSNVGFNKDFYPRPDHTNDNYLDYYVGDYNGAVAADGDNNDNGTDGAHNYCSSADHTQEYCIGHKAGYLVEAYLLNDA